MPEKVDLNVAPYYDDYDASKKYHKVLYRPSRPIQAREITQAQSILQNQIEPIRLTMNDVRTSRLGREQMLRHS